MLAPALQPLFLLSLLAPTAADEVRWIALDPGHFHAALIHKEMLPGVSRLVHVYAPLGPDLAAYLGRIARYNARAENPTGWEMRICAGPDFLERMLKERAGNAVVLSGRNRAKMGRIRACLEAGLSVLADKPWIIEASDLPALQASLEIAGKRGILAYDAMTQRFEITCRLQRELVADAAVFGSPLSGTEEEPAVHMESLHHLLKEVSGAPALRPAWFFEIREQGEGLADVGTHLADLVFWILFPEEPLDWRRDIEVIRAERWPTELTREDFRQVTGEAGFPQSLEGDVKGDRLEYFANTSVDFTVKGIRARLVVLWGLRAAAGEGDREVSVFRGSRSRVEVRQGKEEGFVPQVYVAPNRPESKGEVLSALQARIEALKGAWPGLAAEDLGDRLRVAIPERHRLSHEAHFALLVGKFLDLRRDPARLPAWEGPNMLAKYFVTTRGVEMARRPAARANEKVSR